MQRLKTKDIRTVLYSIVEQKGIEDDLQYRIVGPNRIKESININKDDKVATLKQLKDIRVAMDDGKTCVFFELDKGISFKLCKIDEYYMIDNWEILLNYIICEMLDNTDRIICSVINSQGEYEFLGYNINKNYRLDDTTVPDIVAENIQKISTAVKNKLTSSEKNEIIITNDNFEFRFSLDEYCLTKY